MKRKLLLLVFLLVSFVLPTSIFAESITKEQAQKIATEFLRSQPGLSHVGQLKMVYDGADRVKSAQNPTPALYIYDNPNGKGFVIVSGDDIAYPILGYSYESDFPQENMPVNIREWIEGMEERINYGREKGYRSMELHSTKASTGDVVTKLQTAIWNQGYPYNIYCPKINGASTYTGCTITATAIIMYYHKHPERGTGTIPQYTTSSNSIFMPAVQLGHTYNWSKMLESYRTGQFSQEEANNVARLMSDIGCAVKADYGTDGTGAYTGEVVKALVNYFGYDKSAISNTRSNYTNEDWYNLIKAELNSSRLVLYSGFNDEAGHAFVLDGYTTDNYFSVNWGWGGSYNGFFLLDALNPSGSGIGGNNDHYNFNQDCLTNLMPDAGGDWIDKMGMTGQGFMCDIRTFETNKEYTIVIDKLFNIGNCMFVGNIMCAHTDKDGKIKEILKNYYIPESTELLPDWGWSQFTFDIVIEEKIEEGDRLRMFYKTSRMDDWALIKGGENCLWELIISNSEPIDVNTGISYNKENKLLVIKKKDENIKVKFYNSQYDDLSSRCTEETGKVSINTGDLPSGTYIIKLSRNSEEVEIKVKLN